MTRILTLAAWAFLGINAAYAASPTHFKHVVVVVLENTDEMDALSQPFMGKLAKQGAYFSNFFAVTHPSQPNYIALTSGSTHGVTSDRNVNLNVRHLGDLLEAKGLNWKVYAEDFPGKCFLGATRGRYVRKHVPFLSYVNVQKNPERCARITDTSELMDDLAAGTLPEFSLFIPNLDNDGHDTSPDYADRYLDRTFTPLFKDDRFMKDTLFVLTFDESKNMGPRTNQIYTVLYGPGVRPTSVSARTGIPDLLRTFEDNFGVGTLGLDDAKATAITGIWR